MKYPLRDIEFTWGGGVLTIDELSVDCDDDEPGLYRCRYVNGPIYCEVVRIEWRNEDGEWSQVHFPPHERRRLEKLIRKAEKPLRATA